MHLATPVRTQHVAGVYSEIALSRKPFGIGHMYIYTFCLEWPILWPLRILTFPPETLCVIEYNRVQFMRIIYTWWWPYVAEICHIYWRLYCMCVYSCACVCVHICLWGITSSGLPELRCVYHPIQQEGRTKLNAVPWRCPWWYNDAHIDIDHVEVRIIADTV
jgi:hypothetical protein